MQMLRNSLVVVIMLAALSLAACASLIAPSVKTGQAALRAGDYVLDHDHAALVFKIDHMGFSQFIGRFERFEAALDFDDADAASARLEAAIDITSLDIANDKFATTLMGPQWFHVDAYPKAVFRSTNIEITGDNSGRATGELTLHGVTRPVRLDVTFNGGARDILRGRYVIGFSAVGSFDRKDFGIDRFSGVVGDMVKIEIEAEFLRR